MKQLLDQRAQARFWETQLREQKDDRQQIALLDRLISHYAYTNVQRAKALLPRQESLLRKWSFPDFTLNLYLNWGFIENQLYDFQASNKYYLKAIGLVEERGAVRQQASAYIDYAGLCINRNQMERAMRLLDKADRLLSAFPDDQLKARLTCREGYVQLHYSNFSKAIELLLQADKQISQLQPALNYMDYYFLTLIHSGLGKIYERNNDWEKMVNAYRKVADMCESLGMRTRLSWHYLNMGNGYLAMNNYPLAETFFRKAIAEEDDSSEQARASAYANLGYIQAQGQQYKKALDMFDTAEELFRQHSPDDYYNFTNLERWRAQVYLEMGDTGEVMERFLEAHKYAKKSNDPKQISSIFKEIASFHADIGDYKNAYDYQVLYDKFSEQYQLEVNSRKAMELEVMYEAEKKKKEAELLRLQATQLQLKALRAQMNPHFMYNALNAIQHYITSNEVKNAAKYLAKFAKLMRQSLEYSEMEIISLEKELEFLEDYLTINAKLRFEDRLKFEIQVDDEIEEDILGVPTMIIQPYVENAIEHGLRTRRNGMISVSFRPLTEDSLLCVVEDNGIGREAAQKVREKDVALENQRSWGTSITRRRLEILNQEKDASWYVNIIDLKDPETNEPAGTRVEVRIPIVEIQMK
jgi:two-component system LytT family sensor kinase